MSLSRSALLIAILAAVTVGGAWAFQLAGYAPCELCLKERVPYYAGALLAAVAFVLAARQRTAARTVLALVALVFIASAILGAYHSGVEFGWWAGPADCTGDFAAASSTQDFLKQLQNVQVVRCDAIALRVLGLSLAVWNAIISIVLAIASAVAATRR